MLTTVPKLKLKTTVSISLDPSLVGLLKRISSSEHRTVSNYAELVLTRHLGKRRLGKKQEAGK